MSTEQITTLEEQVVPPPKKLVKIGFWFYSHLVMIALCIFVIPGELAWVLGINSAIWAFMIYKLSSHWYSQVPVAMDPAFFEDDSYSLSSEDYSNSMRGGGSLFTDDFWEDK